VGKRPNASARGAARGRPSEDQRYVERRSASVPSHWLLSGGVGGPPGGGVGRPGGKGRLHPGRRVVGWRKPRETATYLPAAGWRGHGGPGRRAASPPGVLVRGTNSCPQNREQSILSFERWPILTAWTHFFSLLDALYLRNGCPTDNSEPRKRRKGGGLGKCLQAID